MLPFWHVGLLGLPGLLVSPTRGLLVFCPFLIFIAVGLAQRLRTPSSRRLAVALSVAVVAQVLLYSQADWRAGASWGPRWLTDLLPIMIWMLAPAPLVLRARARGLLVVTMVAAVGVQAIGAFWYTHTSDERIFAGNPASLSAAWDPRNTPFIVELEHPPAAFELAVQHARFHRSAAAGARRHAEPFPNCNRERRSRDGRSPAGAPRRR